MSTYTFSKMPIKFTLASSLLIWASAAFSMPWTWFENARPIIGIGGGVALVSDLGDGQTFPIVNPVTDERYHYSPRRASETLGLGNAFIGVESPIPYALNLQLGIAYTQLTSGTVKGIFSQGVDASSTDFYNYRYGILFRQLLLEGKILYTFRERYHPYILVGVGSSFNKAYNYGTSVPPFLTFTRQYANHYNTDFSYAIGAGIEENLDKHFRLGIAYRFTDLGKANLGRATIDTSVVAGTLSQKHAYTNEILAQLTYLC